jgi:hypothetical protein
MGFTRAAGKPSPRTQGRSTLLFVERHELSNGCSGKRGPLLVTGAGSRRTPRSSGSSCRKPASGSRIYSMTLWAGRTSRLATRSAFHAIVSSLIERIDDDGLTQRLHHLSRVARARRDRVGSLSPIHTVPIHLGASGASVPPRRPLLAVPMMLMLAPSPLGPRWFSHPFASRFFRRHCRQKVDSPLTSARP